VLSDGRIFRRRRGSSRLGNDRGLACLGPNDRCSNQLLTCDRGECHLDHRRWQLFCLHPVRTDCRNVAHPQGNCCSPEASSRRSQENAANSRRACVADGIYRARPGEEAGSEAFPQRRVARQEVQITSWFSASEPYTNELPRWIAAGNGQEIS